MTEDAAFALIAGLLTDLFAIAPEKITRTANLYQDLDIDSIDAVDLAIEFKKQTGRQLTPEEFKQIRTVGDIVQVFCAGGGK
ncbi:MAG: acyl carrier protein [Zoogloeaceae bacterium]|nr:acyl carrier protein [Zoogloeaceae bacterium]